MDGSKPVAVVTTADGSRVRPRGRGDRTGVLRAAAISLVAVLAIGLGVGIARGASERAPAFDALEPIAPQQQDRDDPLAGFVLPIWLDPPRGLILESRARRLVTWSVAGSADTKIRIMAPTPVRSDAAEPIPSPSGLRDYLDGLRSSGGEVTRVRALRIGGVPAHRFSLIVRRPTRSGLGCWSDRTSDCFTLAPGVRLQVFTFEVRGEPVLLWSRTWSSAHDPELDALLDRLVRSMSFERWGRSAHHRSDVLDGRPSGAAEIR